MKLHLVTATERGRATRAWARQEIERLRTVARKKQIRLIAGRDQITPPLMDTVERGQGNSINARLHRLING